ncbi:aquaporin [Demequina muriae]|uniref:Aquaporin n=1 Tax=Demequina muriae TaxID=3051664 RepID=A0ABT8GI44_9MICO|nr:aquaporin [Demequina sp. EGI L300058]MDN4480936.1 aquaporin [Demequina sp. EGI L300058]
MTTPDANPEPVDDVFEQELESDVWGDEELAGPSLVSRMLAEAAGTFILVFMGVGAMLFATILGWGTLAVPFGFAIGMMIAVLIFGHVSGAHANPAVTVGAWLSGRFPGRDVVPYIIGQLVGGALAGGLFFVLRSGNPVLDQVGTPVEFMAAASNGFGERSPVQFGLLAALIVEVIIAALLVAVVLSVTSLRSRVGAAAAPVTIGLTFGFLVLIAIPFTNGALNPARATSTALYAGIDVIAQLWLFWLAPLVGAAIAGLLFRAFGPEEDLIIVETIEEIEVIDD